MFSTHNITTKHHFPYSAKSASVRVHTSAIPNYAFAHNHHVTSIVAQATISSIGTAAFADCPRLIVAPFPPTINPRVYQGCIALHSPDLSATTAIDDAAFLGCAAIVSINAPILTSIAPAAFAFCVSITSVRLDSITHLPDVAFSNCYNLRSFTAPALISIHHNALKNTLALHAINHSVSFPPPFPTAVNVLGDIAPTDIVLPSFLPFPTSPLNVSFASSPIHSYFASKIDPHIIVSITIDIFIVPPAIFCVCSALVSLTAPITSHFKHNAFANCKALTTVIAPAAAVVDSNAFFCCIALAFFTTTNLVEINPNAFANTAFEALYLPIATHIDSHAFAHCLSLSSIVAPALSSLHPAAFEHSPLRCFSARLLTQPPPTALHVYTATAISNIIIQ
jgi:hypothetical protein